MLMFKFEREKKGLTQNELADLLGVSQQTISKYENGTREPDIDTLINLSRIFNVSIDYLLGLSTDNQNIYENFSNDIFQCHVLDELSFYNVSEQNFASEVNIDLEKMNEYLHGKKCPSPDELIIIADYLGLSLDFLFGRTERRNLSQDEEDLLDNFEKCSNECKKYLISKAGVLAVEGLIAINSENTQLHNQHSLATGTEDG